MTLEDFFTLSEMKNGITICTRIEELIFAMQKQICTSDNGADAARQWSIAASVLAFTQNKECLSLFVHSNGLTFLNYWLQNALQCGREAADGKELINALLGSLDNLPMNLEKLYSSGIYEAVEKLFSHEDANIGKKARMLFEKWSSMKDINDKRGKLSIEEDAHISSSQTESGRSQNIGSDPKELGNVICQVPNQYYSTVSSNENEPPNLMLPSEIQAKGKETYDQEAEMSEEKGDISSAVCILRCARMDASCPECSKEVEIGSGELDSANNPDLETAENGCGSEYSSEPPLCSEALNDKKIADGLDSESESGEMDALEIARQVAIEVEREVVDYREDLCSSSLEMSSDAAVEEDELCHPKTSEANGNEESAITPNQDDDEATSTPQQHKQKVAETREFLFDLNEEACEDIDCVTDSICLNNSVNLSAPIPVPATSKGTPVPGFLVNPPCFESGLGWKGSAATSAFRPASPRRAFNGKNTDSVSRYKANMIELDLNATDCEYNSPDTSFPYGIPSWSSLTEKMKLDLNSNGEEEDEATPSESFLHKSFDLNDNLFLSKKNDPAIRIPLDRRPRVNQLHPSHTAKGLSFDSNFMSFYSNAHQAHHQDFSYITPRLIPNITDSRGVRNGVQLPFVMNLGGPPLSSNGGCGPSQPASLDLNFGMVPLIEDSIKAGLTLPPAESNTGNSKSLLKRKEPDSGWEPYTFGFQHLASWRQ